MSQPSPPRSTPPFLTSDGWLLFATRSLRMFAYGLLSVVLMLYLADVGFAGWQTGALLSSALIGDIAVSLWITTAADALGRRRMLAASALLMLVSGAIFAWTTNFWILLVVATAGIVSPSDKDIGPFLSLEQAALAQIVSDRRRTTVFAWYNLAGSFSAALGALAGGELVQFWQAHGATGPAAYRPVLVGYSAIAALVALLYVLVSPAIEVARPHDEPATPAARPRIGLHRSRRVVFLLAALFAIDAFGGGFVVQSVTSYWFHLRFGADPATLGKIFLVANLLAGISALAAGWMANRIGLVNTMVFTHLPSNVLLLLVPLMPDFQWAVGLFLLRFSISQMDVPPRQALTMSLVEPDERSAAAGVTAVARSVGASISPLLAGWMVVTPAIAGLPLLLAGAIKIVYDLIFYRAMKGK